MRPEPENAFTSILWPRGRGHDAEGSVEKPETSARLLADCLHDLALDQVLERLAEDATAAREAWTHPLTTLEDVKYRHEVFAELEEPNFRNGIQLFLRAMSQSTRYEIAGRDAQQEQIRDLLHCEAVRTYTDALTELEKLLCHREPPGGKGARGWHLLKAHVSELGTSSDFHRLSSGVLALHDELASLRYSALLRAGQVTVAPLGEESELAPRVRAMFARFEDAVAPSDDAEQNARHERGAVREPHDRRDTSLDVSMVDHVEAWMLAHARLLHEEFFNRVETFAADTERFRDPILVEFADEIRFYLAYLDFVAPMRRAGLTTSLPDVTLEDRELHADGTWDLTLASRLVADDSPVVTGQLELAGDERILVVSGPNQGGKTTLARSFGQLHHLTALGCPVPAESARIPLCDAVLTVFDREENLESEHGRLGAEILRLRDVLTLATSRSAIVINEAFGSTALRDARVLTRDVLKRIRDLGANAVCVTFIDELSRLDASTVSMVAEVDLDEPAVRTFLVTRRRAEGRAYARALADKRGLSGARIAAHLDAVSKDCAEPIGVGE